MSHKTPTLLRMLVAVAVSVGAIIAVAGIATASTFSGPGTAVVSTTATYPDTAPSTPAPTMPAPTMPAPTTTPSEPTPTPTCDECDCPSWASAAPTIAPTIGTDSVQPVAYRRAGNVTYTFTLELKPGNNAVTKVVADPKEQLGNVRNETVNFNACYALRFNSPMRRDCKITSITVVPATITLESEIVEKLIEDPFIGEFVRYFVKFQNTAAPNKEFTGKVTIVITCPLP